ncbi:methyltransferase family protein [Nitratidesulfovibrio sp. 1201_IL3209]|uniref:methyltransferase family protein n=1 Tax=Nitratidesulfovibrio sp. 1201_IL3209 TaxID=3084053 RepID=UPI002FD9265C
MLRDPWFLVQLACALSGFPGALLYRAYFRYRESLRRRGLPPRNMLAALHLLGIPTGHVWLVMPWLPQPRLGAGDSLLGMFTASSATLVAALLGLGLALYAGVYVVRFMRQNFAVTLADYAAPSTLLRTGIYAELRHPGVVAMFYLVAGLSVASGAVYTLTMLPLFVVMLWTTTLVEEREVLLPRFGESYRAYAREVSGFFCPKSLAGLEVFACALGLGLWGGL